MENKQLIQANKGESLDKIVNSKESVNYAETAKKKTGKKWIRIALLTGAIYASALFAPTTVFPKDYHYGDAEPQKPNAALYVGIGTGAGFVMGALNYLIFGKPERRIGESDSSYSSRCTKRFWTYAGIFSGIGAGTGTGVYLYDLDRYKKEHNEWSDAQKINSDDANGDVPPTPFICAGIKGSTLYLGFSSKF